VKTPTPEFPGFNPVGTVIMDDKKRVALARTRSSAGQQYAVWMRPDGTILLLPIQHPADAVGPPNTG
jgi:hypothetical protein